MAFLKHSFGELLRKPSPTNFRGPTKGEQPGWATTHISIENEELIEWLLTTSSSKQPEQIHFLARNTYLGQTTTLFGLHSHSLCTSSPTHVVLMKGRQDVKDFVLSPFPDKAPTVALSAPVLVRFHYSCQQSAALILVRQ